MPSPSPASSRRASCRAMTRSRSATSILDYVFRELAISYLGREDLAHVTPEDLGHTNLGRGDDAEDLPDTPPPASRHISAGLVRGKATNYVTDTTTARSTATVYALNAGSTFGATALKADAAMAEAIEALGFAEPAPRAAPKAADDVATKRSIAKMKGYVGQSLPRMHEFHARPQRDMFEMRYVRKRDGVQLRDCLTGVIDGNSVIKQRRCRKKSIGS